MRSPKELTEGLTLCPSDNAQFGARALTLDEVTTLKQDFVDAAVRAKKCGYNGVELHGAHGYILSQFLSKEINKRTDNYGGSLANHSRLLFEITDEIRAQCGNNFLISIRLSPERFGMELTEVKEVCKRLINENKIDFLDISLWDVFKDPEETEHQHKSLLSHFTELDLKEVKLTVAGKISSAKEVQRVLDSGVDFVSIGRVGILHHDYPKKVMADPNFEPAKTPVSVEHLKNEGLGEAFITYMRRWPNFVESDEA